MAQIFQRFCRDEGGATSIEYAMIASLMAIVAIAALRALGDNTSTMYGQIDSAMAGAAS